MMEKQNTKRSISGATGKLGILIPGVAGAVASTFIAGVMATTRGIGQPIGSLTQMGRIRLGGRAEKRFPLVKDFIPLTNLSDIVFGGWDLFPDSVLESARHAKVLENDLLSQLEEPLSKIVPMKAVFDQQYVKRLNGTHCKSGPTKMDLARQIADDIEAFQAESGAERVVGIWCGSTEIYIDVADVPATLSEFEEGLRTNHPSITPSMIYAYAFLQKGYPYANGAPNLALDLPALIELSKKTGAPIAGKDFKTGQTLMKTIIGPGIKARNLGVEGWFSTNILGNRDGEVLDDPDSFKTKEVSKLSVLDTIFQPELYPDLYKDFYHKVRINYYPPRGDNKESWDNIDIVGWLGYPMQIKLNFLCRDSILAAPLVLDLALLLDFAKRAELSGIQEWLSFYFKCPMTLPNLYPEHDVFIQLKKLKNTLRYLMGEEMITHLGSEYFGF